MTDSKTPDPDAMGGPGFHPEIQKKEKPPVARPDKAGENPSAGLEILTEDQVPPL